MFTSTARKVTIFTLLLSLAAAPTLASAASTTSARTLLTTSLAGAAGKLPVSAHITISTKGAKAVTENFVIGATFAYGSIAATGASGPVKLNIIVLDSTKTIYVQSSASGLTYFFSTIKSSFAKSHANQWLKLTPSDPEYTYLTFVAATNGSLSPAHLVGSLKALAATSYAGIRVTPITGKTPGQDPVNATLYVSATLPVAEVHTSGGTTTTVTWSKWGQGTKPNAPSNPTTFPTKSK